MRSLTSSRPWWSASSTARAAATSCTVLGALVPRQLEDRVEPGADPAGLRGLLAGALELVDLAQRGLADRLGQVGRLDPGAVVVRAVGLALAELLADGGELLAEQELALVLLQALADVLADLVVDLVLGVVGPRPLDEQAQPVAHVGGLQHLALLVVGEVRRVAGGVGERVGVGEASYGLDHLPRLAALQDRDDEGAVVLGERAELVGDDRLGHGLGLDPEGRTGPGHAGADGDAALGAQHRGGPAAGEAADPVDHGDHAVGGVAVLEPRGDEDAGGLVVGGSRWWAASWARRAASMAARAWSSSSMGTTMPGSTTVSWRNTTGREMGSETFCVMPSQRAGSRGRCPDGFRPPRTAGSRCNAGLVALPTPEQHMG